MKREYPDLLNDGTMSRKCFLLNGGKALCAMALGGGLLSYCSESPLFSGLADEYFTQPARHWKALGNGVVQCRLCPNQCALEKGDTGTCRVRKNIGGRLFTTVYGRIAAQHTDPIEKKPFYHFLPGKTAYSVATAGCNIACKFCQNWQISQSKPENLESLKITPSLLGKNARSQGAPVIAYTYNEPTVQFEYIMDSAAISRSMGLKSVIVSNGYILPAPGRQLASRMDGIKIDLKAFTDSFYRNVCSGAIKPVLRTIEMVHSLGKWLELVILVIPTLNDSAAEIRNMARWVRKNLSPDVPMHFTRFHAMYLIRNLPPTPISTLERCRTIAREEGIRYSYVGNAPGHRWNNTYCHNCDKQVISRGGFFHVENSLKSGKCPHCKTRIPGVWS